MITIGEKSDRDRFLTAAFRDNNHVELRGLLLVPRDGSHAWSGTYWDQKAFERDVERAESSGKFKGLYVTLNRPYWRDVTNRLELGVRTTTDADIERITRLPFDFDPVRTEANSDADELDAAKQQGWRLVDFLRARGWPEPLQAMSGNGWHLQYRIDIPADVETRDILAVIYRGLKLRFDLPEVAFDTSIRNPSRIFRLYGTTARKGEHTADRPQRVSECWIDEPWELVGLDLLEELARELKPLPQPVVPRPRIPLPVDGARGNYQTLDVVSWFTSNGHYLRDLGDGKHAVICPWSDEHSEGGVETGTVIWEARDSWPKFRCLHAHCDQRRIADVMAFFGDADRFCSESWAVSAGEGA